MREKRGEQRAQSQKDTAVRFEHVSMQFPGVLANDDVSFEVRKGEVFALIGENGAGKSTLMNILYGICAPTGGSVYVKGEKLEKYSPGEAMKRGVGMVHQHFMLVPSFSAAQNVVIGKEPRKKRIFYDLKEAERITAELSALYGLRVDPRARVQEIGVGLQQRVEILKTLYRGADILILDEPTAVLTPRETEELFAVIKKMTREKGMTVILITHKLYEVMAVSDRTGVMRQGKLIGIRETKAVNERLLSAMMTGREVFLGAVEKSKKTGEVKLKAESLRAADNRGITAVNDVSFQVRGGEILGIAAVEGNGQSELIEAITGLRAIEGGTVRINGEVIDGKTPGQIREAGLAHIPEDRLATGLSGSSSVADNLIAGKERQSEFSGIGLHIRRDSVNRYAEELFARFDMRGAGIDAKAGSLSGGNMQKVVLAREFSFDASVLIISQPTRGVDIGTVSFIHEQILRKRGEGCAILLSSADLEELLRLSDRIITLYEGRITGEFRADDTDKEEIGYYMTGTGREKRKGDRLENKRG